MSVNRLLVPQPIKHYRNCKNGLTVIRDKHEVQVVKTDTKISHNTTGPAFRRYDYDFVNGSIFGIRYCSLELWVQNDITHRDDDNPAVISSVSNDYVYEEQYMKHGKRHRIFGPAIIRYHKDGTLRSIKYYVNGNQLTEKFINEFLTRWDLSSLAELKTNEPARIAFLLECPC